MKRKRSKQTTLNIKGKLCTAVTIAGLAEILGKSVDSIRRYEKLQVFPKAPFMAGEVRYYPVSLAKRLQPIVDKFKSNKSPDAETIAKINQLFKEERSKYAE